MSVTRGIEEVRAWQKARTLAGQVHTLTAAGATDAALAAELRRAAVGVMTALAAGHESADTAVMLTRLAEARVRLAELRSLCYVALDLGVLGAADFEALDRLVAEVGQQCVAHGAYLRQHAAPRPTLK